MAKRIDLDTMESRHSGLKGAFERFMRRFKVLFQILMLMPLYVLASLSLGLCLVPGIWLVKSVFAASAEWLPFFQFWALGVSLAAGYFLYGFALLLVAPALNFAIRGNLKAWRGPYFSLESFKWFLHNGCVYLARYTFLEFVTPTPISNLFYQMMGMKIGRGVVINSTFISDPSLIEIGDKTTIGGSVTLVAHYGQGGLLVIAPVKIGKGCTIGLKATVMGGAEIGDGAKVMPHSVVMPKTVIPPGETWGGVPAQKISLSADPSKLDKAS